MIKRKTVWWIGNKNKKPSTYALLKNSGKVKLRMWLGSMPNKTMNIQKGCEINIF